LVEAYYSKESILFLKAHFENIERIWYGKTLNGQDGIGFEEYLMSIRSLLNDNGKLIIEVPNYSSWTRKLTNKYWLGLDLKYHRTFFSTHTLTNLLKKNNFNVKLVHTFSLEYSIFISAQSIISLITDTDHSIFKYLQGEKLSFGKKIFHFCLLIILFPICFIINLNVF